jgi:hypothetical protein
VSSTFLSDRQHWPIPGTAQSVSTQAPRALPPGPRSRSTTATRARPNPVHDLPHPKATKKIGRAKAACTCVRNAGIPIAGSPLVRITHPFHPLTGQQFACIGERFNRYGRRLLLEIDGETVCSVPPQWTDLVGPDPEIVSGQQRAAFRVADLLELLRLVERFGRANRQETPDEA